MTPPELLQHLQQSVIKLSYPPFMAGMFDMVYEIYPYFMTYAPPRIPKFLRLDFFGTKRTPGGARPSAPKFGGSLDEL
jgi:hypothetical protein